MGLDMFAYRVRKGLITEEVDFRLPDDDDSGEQLHYWRKHPDLHGWMENLYYKKGGKGETFNCDVLQLTEEDLDRLEEDLNEDGLPETHGFFFGESEPEDKIGDLEFIKQAREAISEGFDVYYTSWW